MIFRAAKSCWNPKLFKEIFCVDSSVHMNSLALALVQGGVRPKEMTTADSEATQKGLYFRQFLPHSAAVRLFNF